MRKKFFLLKKHYSHYFSIQNKWHLRNQLLKTKSDKIYVYINDPILGVNTQAIGENKIGGTLENIRTLLTKSKPKNEMLDNIYKCSSSPIIKSWLKEKYEELIVTVKIFAKFFDISPINTKVVKYIIDNIYLPNVSIYLNCQKSIPSEEFIANIKDRFIHTPI